MYEGERLQQLMDSIENVGLMSPVIVRPIDNGKYEIICGHNRTKAVEELDHDTIRADIRHGLSDDTALELFYDSNLNQQSFSDWNYSEKLKAIKYSEKLIRENSNQGKRTDLEPKTDAGSEEETCVQSRQKLNGKTKRTTSRDKMARRLGISTATLSKYRRIIKLSDDLIQSIARLLDEQKITFNAAYIISNLEDEDITSLIKGIERYPDRKLDLDKLKALPDKNAKGLFPVPRDLALEVLVPLSPSSVKLPIIRKDS